MSGESGPGIRTAAAKAKKKESASIKNLKDWSAVMEPTKSPTGRVSRSTTKIKAIWRCYHACVGSLVNLLPVAFLFISVDECPIIDTSFSSSSREKLCEQER